jgi:hypothetical protein
MRNLVSLPLLIATACVQTVSNGPDLGPCAVYPDEAYAYGQAGIGSCLAGPSDLQFVDGPDGRYLIVVNADPFRLFESGSILSIPVSELSTDEAIIPTTELNSTSLTMEHFLGRFALFGGPGSYVGLMPSRYSADAYATIEPDKVWMVDLSNPAEPRLRDDRPFVTVRQDPFDVELYGNLAFVISPTDNAISVINMGAQPPTLLDPAPQSQVRDVSFADADASGSTAELVTTIPTGAEIYATDVWTASWVPGTDRLWVPQADGLARYNDGGDGDLLPSGLGVEVGSPGTVWETTAQPMGDAWFSLSSVDASARLFMPQGDTVRYLASYDPFGVWNYQSGPVLAGTPDWAATIGGPAVLDVAGRRLLYFDGRADDTTAQLGVATTADGEQFSALGDALHTVDAGGFTALIQPSPIVDPFLGLVRIWASARVGDRWVVALTESGDGVNDWSTPTTVLEVPGESAGAPHVEWYGGTYHMRLAVSQGGVWWYATSSSFDGLTWTEPELLRASEHLADPAEPAPLTARPPRTAVQIDPRLAWDVSGDTLGQQPKLIYEGIPYSLTQAGIVARVSSGFTVGAEIAGPLSEAGIEPTSLVTTGAFRTLYATATDADAVPHLVALRQAGDRWTITAVDLIPSGIGGNAVGAQSPSVFATDDGYEMLYASGQVDGTWLMRRATSTDGVRFTPIDGTVFADPPSWMAGEQFPHGVERTSTGWRVWFAADEGTNDRYRIGAADSVDGLTWTLTQDTPIIEPGEPGQFDDAAVRDPQPAVCAGEAGLWYSAYDGERWTIGFVSLDEDLAPTRFKRPLDDTEAPVMASVAGTFAASGSRAPVAAADEAPDGSCTVLTSGYDGERWRVGSAISHGRAIFPTFQAPTPGDEVRFTAVRGEPGTSTIDLGQYIGGFGLPGSDGAYDGAGPSVLAMDEARGLLFVAGKTSDVSYPLTGVIVVDVRDDSTADWTDTNYLDIETFIWLETVTTSVGVQDIVYDPTTSRLYLAAKDPGSVWVVDTTDVVDDNVKEITYNLPSGLIPMHDVNDDAGETTFAIIGPSGLALVPNQGLLLVTHFKDNALSVIDLNLGVWGEEIRYHQDIGENPSVVRTSPDGTFAVVANYLGAVSGNTVGSSIVLLDLDPLSPTWLEITTRIDNR